MVVQMRSSVGGSYSVVRGVAIQACDGRADAQQCRG